MIGIKKLTIVVAVVGSILGGSGSNSFGEVLSVNIHEFAGDVQKVLSAYGVPAENSVVDGWVNTQQSVVLTDIPLSDGTATTIDMTGTTPNSYASFNAIYNNTPLRAGIDDYTGTTNPTSITLSDIGATFSSYNAIVYLTGFNGNTGATITDGTVTYSYQTADPPDATLVQTTDTGMGFPVANYAVFSGLTADSVTFTLDTVSGGGAGIGGVQLVGVVVPEPSGTCFMLVGLLSLFARRFRLTAGQRRAI